MIPNVLDMMRTVYSPANGIGYPSYVLLDLVSDCNLSCVMCRNTPDAMSGKMEFSLYQRVIDELSPGTTNFMLFHCGETLMLSDQELENYVAYVAKKKCNRANLFLTTNGMLLNKKKCEILMKYGVNIDISIDSMDKIVLESIRRGAKLETILDNVNQLFSIRKSLGSESSIGLSAVIQKDNLQGLDAIADYVINNNFDRIGFAITTWPREITISSTRKNVDVIGKTLKKLTRSGINIYEIPVRLGKYFWNGENYTKIKSDKIVNTFCSAPSFFTVVGYDGEVSTCCRWPMTLGNIKTNSWKQIWNGKSYEFFRKIVNDDRAPSVCKECNLANRI
ncbi:SPASM domain-containing protein [bacterium]|nr:SPASM domain-containing protein [bacterium]